MTLNTFEISFENSRNVNDRYHAANINATSYIKFEQTFNKFYKGTFEIENVCHCFDKFKTNLAQN